MAASIKQEFSVDAQLIKGGSGVFNVVVDGRKIYSKHETGRFPEAEEVLSQLRG